MSVFARWQRTIVDEAGDVVPGASVEVRNAETNAMATLYSDRGGTTGVSNPVTADAEGFAGFFVGNGLYRITATSGAFSRVWDYVGITSVLEIDAAAAGRVDQVTWSGLDVINGTREGQPAIVYGPDAGTHTDPVVGGTVANTGRYIWSVSPEGWRRVAGLEANLVHAENSGSGTANAVQATTASTYNTSAYGALFTVNFTAQNTGAMTLSINGETPRSIVANDGSAIPAGYVDNDMSAQFQIDDDGNYRLANIRGPAGSSSVVGTSTTSLAIGAGSKAFTIVETDRGWGVGARLRVSSDADPSNSMTGLVTSYSGSSLIIDVATTGGSGTFADWTINLAGEPGSGDLLSTNNLSDLDDAGESRLNLEIGQFADRAALAAATIPASIKNVYLEAYDATVDPSRGDANWKRISLVDIISSGYPPEAYERSQDRFLPDETTDVTNGGYFLLWEDKPHAEQFGGLPNCVLNGSGVYVSGTDNLAALNALIGYMAAREVDGHLGSGTYYSSGQVVNDSGKKLLGDGRLRTKLHCRLAAAEVGVWSKTSGSMPDHMTISVEPYEAKLANNGQLHSCLMVSSHGYFSATTHTEISDVSWEDLGVHRADNATSSGYGVFCIGYITGGKIGLITSEGSPRAHTAPVQFHWSGNGTGYGSAVTETYHVGDITIDEIFADGDDGGLAMSSTYGIKIKRLRCRGTKWLLQVLPGDETNRLAVAAQADLIGYGNKIDEILFEDMQDTADDGIDMFSVGTSPFDFYAAPDDAVDLRTTLYIDLEIGLIKGRNTTPRAKKLFDAFQFFGNCHVGTINVGDSFTTTQIFDADRSHGITVDKIIGSGAIANGGLLELSRGEDITIGRAIVTGTDIDTSTARAISLFGDRTDTTLAANAAAGATSITIVASAERILKNQRLIVDGQHVRATEYYAPGCTVIGITPLPAAATSADTVTIDHYLYGDIGVYTKGGRAGVRALGFHGTFRGDGPEGSGLYAYQIDGNCDIDLMRTRLRNNGLQRIASGSAATRELIVALGSTVRHHSGTLGNDSPHVEYNVALPTSDAGTDRRYTANMVRYMGSVVGRITASSVTDFELFNCTDALGAIVTT